MKIAQYYTDLGVVDGVVKGCKGEDFKLHMRVLTFRSEWHARRYLADLPEDYEVTTGLTNVQTFGPAGTLVKLIEKEPDELVTYHHYGVHLAGFSEDDLRMALVKENGIQFRLGRHVGHYSVEEWGDNPLAAWDVLPKLVDETTSNWPATFR